MSVYTMALGIDPGRTGAFGWIGVGSKMPRVQDMPPRPTHVRGNDLACVDAILAKVNPTTTLVGLEWPTARPGEVPDFAFRFGMQCGELEALLYARGFTFDLIAPNRWTGAFGIPGKSWEPDLHFRVSVWDDKYPAYTHLVRGPRGGILDGRLDALLIAEYVRIGIESPFGHKGGRRPPTHR
jgi:hypothetical protein